MDLQARSGHTTRVLSLDQNKVLLENATATSNWAYTFVGWDSAWYLSIMTRGYGFSPQSYAFSPILPFMGRVLDLLLQSPVVSIAVCSLVFGVLWIPFYQLVAEKYMSKQELPGSALIFALSPYMFLFTTLVYTEGLFLFLTLNAWYLFKMGKITSATGLAAVSALTRIVGLVLVLPMLIVSLSKKVLEKFTGLLLAFFQLLHCSLGWCIANLQQMIFLRLCTLLNGAVCIHCAP